MAVPDPQGWKEYAVNDVVTASEYMGYAIQQIISVFADATARDAAITAPKEGQFAFLKDTDSLTRYDGAAWVNAVSVEGTAVLATGVTDGYVLTADGADGTAWEALLVSAFPNMTVITATDATWDIPAETIYVEVVGGGGGGAGHAASEGGSGGGGGGGYAAERLTGLTINDTVAVTIGAAGAAGSSSPGAGGTGGASSFGAYCSATGGAGGAVNGAGGAGGAGSSGGLNITGQGGGGGGPNNVDDGAGGSSHYGGGARGGTNGVGIVGGVYGGGGSGGGDGAGGAGAAGVVIVRW